MSALFPQLLLDVHGELIVDLFAGGGGASLGIEMATGRAPDVAVNHDAAAVALHAANHPQTRHLCSDVFEVDPREVTRGRAVGLLWASPDCTFHSKARGAKPFRSKETKRRALAWVVTRWAGQVRPRVIMLENVEEFAQWGPLVGPRDAQRPDPRRRGATFRAWVRSLVRLGYQVEHRELRACDYGAPTIRKRLFLIARCDGAPIVWPEPTHGPGRPRPYRTAAECIDWSVPMLSIFATREEARTWGRAHGQPAPVRPLAEATMRRIARGVKRFVLDNPRPFILRYQSGDRTQAARAAEDPLGTVLAGGARPALVSPFLVQHYGERAGQQPRVRSVQEPYPVIVPTSNSGSLVGAFFAKHYGGHETPGAPLDRPISALTTQDHHHLVTAHLSTFYGDHAARPDGERRGAELEEPLRTQGTANRHGLVAAFLSKYYGQGVGSGLGDPAPTTTTKDRAALVTVEVAGEPYVVADIAMRMLQPRELYTAQGFHPGYIIDRGADGRRLTKTEQVRMVGNSVSPPQAAALVRANVPELAARDEVAA